MFNIPAYDNDYYNYSFVDIGLCEWDRSRWHIYPAHSSPATMWGCELESGYNEEYYTWPQRIHVRWWWWWWAQLHQFNKPSMGAAFTATASRTGNHARTQNIRQNLTIYLQTVKPLSCAVRSMRLYVCAARSTDLSKYNPNPIKSGYRWHVNQVSVAIINIVTSGRYIRV